MSHAHHALPPYTGFTTRQIHDGLPPETASAPRVPPVHLSAGFMFSDAQEAEARFAGDDPGYVYTRVGNPTNADVEHRMTALEGGSQALLLASGQAATTVALLGLLSAGDHVVCSGDIYEGTRGLLEDNLGQLGVRVDFVADSQDLSAWASAIQASTRVLFVESLSNPRNVVADIAALADLAHAHDIPLVVDNTLATPYLLRPLEHGADVVVHSASKFLSGHGGALGGVIVVGAGFDAAAKVGAYTHLRTPHRSLSGASYVQRYGHSAYAAYLRSVVAPRFGPTASPFNAFLIRQGIETLSLRMERHCGNATLLTAWLASRPEVSRVDYSGLPEDPSYRTAARYLQRGQGSVFSFEVLGGAAGAHAFIHATEVFTHMSHLGDVRSLIMHPATTSHALRSPAERAAAGIGDGVLRVSVGIEDFEDLRRDLDRGLAAVRAVLRRESRAKEYVHA